jgi:response regulator RpfG family c-di-GMP phosphodiesterase
MDIQMPEMDGNEVAKYVRSNMGAKSNVPIIALTAHATLAEEKRSVESGMNDYLSKPFDFNVLLEKLHHNLTNANNSKSSDLSQDEEVIVENLINFKYLNEFADGDNTFVEKMVSLFLQNAPPALETIMEANNIDDIVVLKAEVHKLKSSVSLLGIAKASKCIEIIENEMEINPMGQIRKDEIEKFHEICQCVFNELETVHGFSKI